jgi:hypothetical protein
MTDLPREDRGGGLVRLSVVLGRELSEHVRLQAFLTRRSQSAYVRGLIEDEAHRLLRFGEAVELSRPRVPEMLGDDA